MTDTSILDPRPLSSFRKGSTVELAFFALPPPEEQRLRDLGLRECQAMQVLKNDDAILLRIDESRVAVRLEVAMNIFVGVPE